MSVKSSPTQAEVQAHTAVDVPGPSQPWALPLCFIFLKGAGWLVVASLFGFIASIKFHSPEFLADSAWLTYGRVQAAALNALIYGFCVPAGLGFAVWRFARSTASLCPGLVRAPNLSPPLPGLIFAGGVLWNIGVLVGIIGILLGDLTGFPCLEMPGYAAPILFAGYTLVAVWATLAFHLREQRRVAVSQWFLLASLFWFPWIFSSAVLLLNQFSVRGIAQAVVAWWYGGNLTLVWMGLAGLAGILFLAPRFGWRPTVSRHLALFVFWTLMLFGSWTGIPLVAPVPAWMVAMSKIATAFLVLPAIGVALICFGKIEPGSTVPTGSRVVSFIRVGAIAFVLHLLALALPALLSAESRVLFTWFVTGNNFLAVYGFFTLVMFAVIYSFAADVSDAGLPFPIFVRAHFLCSTIGLALIVIPMMVGGIIQGQRLGNSQVAFMDVTRGTLMFLRISTLGDLLILVGHLLFLINFGVFVQRLAVRSVKAVFAPSNAPQLEEVKA